MVDQESFAQGLNTLLEMNGEVFYMENGYWTKIEAKTVAPNEKIPHGVKYSLTLHNNYNNRIIGYDNAHGIKPKRNNYCGKRLEWDHKHERHIVTPYEFESPAQLLADFWNDVNRVIENHE